ncbi:M20/M25/M40 family metallo-hydrolase [Brenneria corticis]|uniref:Peptidase M20 n=1 Tax=Brenneria corticis TaxID=2173106 RepID=A0A2U1TSX8_9GAMM|nr:M20/M25/M40 family metallo-hydrolase [Brenneria sp. CFCC 11842]PWC12508.1 peptidase M20 [Brenneria sp. CFCC 11842]
MTEPLDASVQATLELLTAIAPFRSVAGEIAQQRGLAQWLESWLETELGARPILPVCRQLSHSAPPLVHARLEMGAAKTLVLYNMYDVMPATPQGWDIPPFTGGVTEWPTLGAVFIARGAENNKGPLAGMLMAVKQLLAAGKLTVNIEFILEGEEETGSGNLRRYLAQRPCPVSPAAAVLFPSLCEYGGGEPRVYLGFTGLCSGRLSVSGGPWGGPQVAIHASNAGWIANPAWRLVDALNAIAPAHANGVLNNLIPDKEADALLAELAKNFSMADELRFRRSERPFVTGDALSSLRQWLGGAVLNLAEIHTDPPGGKGVIPSRATAELALRIPPGLSPEQAIASARQRLASPGLEGVELRLDDSYPGYRFSRRAAGVSELLASYRRLHARPQIWPWAPGCAPAYAFAPVAPAFLIGGLGHGGNAHGVNEFVTLRGLRRFQQSLTSWLSAF